MQPRHGPQPPQPAQRKDPTTTAIHKIPLTWPLTPLGQIMADWAIIKELQATISEINSRADSPVFILQPDPEDITIDKQAGTVTANCEWYSKQELRKQLQQ